MDIAIKSLKYYRWSLGLAISKLLVIQARAIFIVFWEQKQNYGILKSKEKERNDC